MAGTGYCKDYVYLPEGGYPSLLGQLDPLYDKNRIKECMNRCLYASSQGLAGSKGAVDTTIREHAFYIRKSDQGCACSSGICNDRKASSGYTSYYIISSNFKKNIILGLFLIFIKTH